MGRLISSITIEFSSTSHGHTVTVAERSCCWHVTCLVIAAFRESTFIISAAEPSATHSVVMIISDSVRRISGWKMRNTIYLCSLCMQMFTTFHSAGPECFPNRRWLRINSHPACSAPLLYFPCLSPRFRFLSGPETWDRTSDHCFSSTHGLLVASAGRGSHSNHNVLVLNLTRDLLLHADILVCLRGPILHRAVLRWAIKQIQSTKAENVIK